MKEGAEAGTHLSSEWLTSCSCLWKYLTRLFAASLMSSCTSTDSIPENIKNSHKQRCESGWWQNEEQTHQKGDTGVESVIVMSLLTSRSAIVVKNVFFVSTYCFGLRGIPALFAHSEKEKPAPGASRSTFQHPPLHQVTPAVQSEPFPSCRHPRLSRAIGRTGTWKKQCDTVRY